MASTTATLPTGHKVRTASQSPMVLFVVGSKDPFIEKRSANRQTIAKAAQNVRERFHNARVPQPRTFIVFTDGTGRVEEI